MAGRDRPDTQALMQQILGNALGGQDANYLAGFNSNFANDINQAYQNLVGKETGFDTQETQARTDYERKFGDIAAAQATATKALRDRLAARGMFQSTEANNQENDLISQFDTQRADLGSWRDAMLNQISGGRLGAEGDYDTSVGNIGQNLSQLASQWIGGKAQEQRDRDLAKQQADADAALRAQQAAAAQAQTAALQQAPQPNLAAFTQAIQAAYNPPPPPPAPKPPTPVAPVNPNKTAANPYLADPFGVAGKNPIYNPGGGKPSQTLSQVAGFTKRPAGY